jgi:hypothetical protein
MFLRASNISFTPPLQTRAMLGISPIPRSGY